MPNTKRAKVIFDATSLRYLHTGLGQVAYHLLEEFARLPHEGLDLFALVNPKYKAHVPQGIPVMDASTLRRHSPPFIQKYLYGSCQLWHMTTEHTRLTGFPSSAKVILSLQGLHFLDETKGDTSAQLRHMQSLVDKVDVITAISHYTAGLAAEKLDLKGKKIVVIPCGISVTDEPGSKPVWAPPGKFIFSIGTFFERKNLHVLLPMMSHLPGMVLVLAGDYRHPYGEFIRTEIERLALQAQVVMPGEITDAERRWLYQQGEALVFPSVSEGFGLPVVESFFYGKPVFCGRYGSLPEVGGTHGFYWENFDPDQMAAMVSSKLALESAALAGSRKEHAKKYSWSAAARAFIDLYGQTIHDIKS